MQHPKAKTNVDLQCQITIPDDHEKMMFSMYSLALQDFVGFES